MLAVWGRGEMASRRRRQAADEARVWSIGGDGADAVARLARPGDQIRALGKGAVWRWLRRLLGERDLLVVPLGRGLFVLDPVTAPAAGQIEAAAHALEAKKDSLAGRALADLLEENGLVRSMSLIRVACRTLPPKRRKVPGGVDVSPRPFRPPDATADDFVSAEASRRATAKLSRLHREILQFALAMGDLPGGAPLDLVRAGKRDRAFSAVLSRSLVRLARRGLITVGRTAGGRATHIRLTDSGVFAAGARRNWGASRGDREQEAEERAEYKPGDRVTYSSNKTGPLPPIEAIPGVLLEPVTRAHTTHATPVGSCEGEVPPRLRPGDQRP
jgi:hypothetical protein